VGCLQPWEAASCRYAAMIIYHSPRASLTVILSRPDNEVHTKDMQPQGLCHCTSHGQAHTRASAFRLSVAFEGIEREGRAVCASAPNLLGS